MYSRGNSPEKRRIAGLSNVAGSVVVDMCCGIGFFAFGYLLAGAAQVIGCEISAWAVEGLRRGAILNGVPYEIVDPKDELAADLLGSTSARLVIFPGKNELALPIYRHRATHVNLGLLPSSVEFLPQAVDALRPEGGWLHVHGELAVGGGPSGRQLGAKLWADELVQHVLSLGRQSAKTVDIHWIKSIGPAKEHVVVELEVGSNTISE
jgi:tRNA G37 N-methylase Trm5